MAEEMDEEVLDKESAKEAKAAAKAAKKEEKARKKEEKKRARAEREMEEEETTTGGKIAVFFVTLIIVLIWLAIIVLLIKWDVGGFGSTVLAPVLKDVPYLNKILPDGSVPEAASTEDTQYMFDDMDAAIARIKELERELADAQNASTTDAEYIAQLEEQARELEQYKQDEAAFEEEKQKFYEEVVFSDVAPDIEEYKQYYESIDPANAEVIYRQVVEQTASDEELDQYVQTYSSMKPKNAAAIFDTMTGDLGLVARIMENMDAQTRADILAEMNTDTAAQLTHMLEP